ncbi:MAG: hypothetical protein JNM79_01685 [Burkholderiales bacterium]|nr:hypothetical protein [Burkholderiales bacterium]
MSNRKPRKEALTLLPDFKPASWLWEGPSPMFPSEQSARWVLRQQRQALNDARALAMLCGRLLVHPQRFVAVIEASAIEAARRAPVAE